MKTPRRTAMLVSLLLLATVAGCRPRPPAQPLRDRDPVFVIPAIRQTAAAGEDRRVGELIDLLESDDAAIRLTTIDALERLTGQTLGFVWWSNEADRAAAVGRWRAWQSGPEQ